MKGVWMKVILRESMSEKLQRFRSFRNWSGNLGIGDFMTERVVGVGVA
jgi:hypothetical protein